MDYKGQTAVLLSIFVLVGMIFLVPAITEKALAGVNAVATIRGCSQGLCKFTVSGSQLEQGKWVVPPTASGDTVKWQTSGNPPPGNEKGYVYLQGAGGARGKVSLFFNNPLIGKNSCEITPLYGGVRVSANISGNIISPHNTPGNNFDGTCDAGSGFNADFTYTFIVNRP